MTRAFPPTVLIDGPSGSGKTTAAASLGRHTGWRVVHLDDYYPGWGGLAAGSDITAHSVLATAGESVTSRRGPGFFYWDWENDCRGEWEAIDPRAPLIVEGVGALTRETYQAARRRGGVVSWVLNAPPQMRKKRALHRDPDYEPFWDQWAVQEAKHFTRWVDNAVVPDFFTRT